MAQRTLRARGSTPSPSIIEAKGEPEEPMRMGDPHGRAAVVLRARPVRRASEGPSFLLGPAASGQNPARMDVGVTPAGPEKVVEVDRRNYRRAGAKPQAQ